MKLYPFQYEVISINFFLTCVFGGVLLSCSRYYILFHSLGIHDDPSLSLNYFEIQPKCDLLRLVARLFAEHCLSKVVAVVANYVLCL